MNELYLIIFLFWLSFIILFCVAIVAIRNDLNDIKKAIKDNNLIKKKNE